MKAAISVSLGLLLATAPALFAQGDAPGTIKATTKIRPDGTNATTVVNPDTQTAEETITDSKNKVLKKTTFLLDERNFAIGAVHYDGKGVVRYKESFSRDPMNHVIESRFSSGDGQALGRRVFVYNGDKVTRFDDYDALGNLIVPQKPASPGRPDKKRR